MPFYTPRLPYCRSQILAALETLNTPTGLEKLRRVAKIPEPYAAQALLQLELRGIVVRDLNPIRKGFTWRLAQPAPKEEAR